MNNTGSPIGEYLRVCSRRAPYLLGAALAVFIAIFSTLMIITPTKYIIQGKIRLVSAVEAQTISDQSDLANISEAAAATTIGLIENSDTVGLALTRSYMANDIDPAWFANERIKAEIINDSDIIQITVIFDNSSEQAITFTYNFLTVICEEISGTNYYGTAFTGEIVEDGRQIGVERAAVYSLKQGGLGALCVLILYMLIQAIAVAADKTLRSNDKFDKISRIPVIASIPSFSRLANSESNAARISNSYRVLRSAIKYSQDKVRSVAVCSASPKDGRTTVAIGLATALAETDSMVLLIEADMRRPNISKEMHIESSFGLADLLLGKTNLASTICKTSNRNLYVITGINNTNLNNVNISDLLDSAVFDELLEAVQGQFDYVIIDTPSVELAPEATSIVGKVDCAVIIAQYGHTKLNSMRSALDVFTAAGGNLIGITTTNTPQHSGLFVSLNEIGEKKKKSWKNPINAVFGRSEKNEPLA